MMFVRQNFLLVVLILLTFLGQVMASTINTCQNDSLVKQKSTHSMLMKHAEHALAGQSGIFRAPIFVNGCDCCELECHCPMGNCVPVVFSALNHNALADFEFEKFEQTPLSTSSPAISSLFRPPILF